MCMYVHCLCLSLVMLLLSIVSCNLFIVLMTTAHEEPGGGQDGGCVDEVTQQTLSK